MFSKYLRFVDTILGSFLYYVLGLKALVFKNRRYKNNKILAIKLWALGETVLIMPGLKCLKEKGYKISLLATNYNAQLARLYNIFDEIIVFENCLWKLIRKIKGYGIIIDFEPFTKFSAVLTYLSGANKRIGFENRKIMYTDWVRADEKEHAVKNFCKLCLKVEKFRIPDQLPRPKTEKQKKENAVCFHPGSGGSSKSRRWPKEQWIELGKKIKEKWPGMKIYITGSKDEAVLCYEIKNSIGEGVFVKILSLEKFLSLCSGVKLFVGNDSGPIHMACSVGCPTIGIFGPNSPERYGPYGKNCMGIRKEKGGVIIRPFAGKFPEDDGAAIKKVCVDDVFKHVKNFLGD